MLTFKHEGGVRTLSVSPDGTRLASGGSRTIRIWDLRSARGLLLLRGHPGVVHALAFSPDGSRLASGGNDYDAAVLDAMEAIILA